MKTKVTLTMMALVLAVSTWATNIPQLNLVVLDDSKAVLSAITDPAVNSEISVTDENGSLVYYKESTSATGISSVFDFKGLENGSYTFSVKSGTASASQAIAVRNGKIEVKEAKTELEPYFTVEGDVLKISFLNFDKDDVSLYIYNNNKEVYTQALGNSFVVQDGFDLAKLDRGVYDVVLAEGAEEVYSYRISL